MIKRSKNDVMIIPVNELLGKVLSNYLKKSFYANEKEKLNFESARSIIVTEVVGKLSYFPEITKRSYSVPGTNPFNSTISDY